MQKVFKPKIKKPIIKVMTAYEVCMEYERNKIRKELLEELKANKKLN